MDTVLSSILLLHSVTAVKVHLSVFLNGNNAILISSGI